MAGKAPKKEPTFEEELSRLEQMADRMEKDDLPLEELLKLFQEGMVLSGELTKKLEGMKAAMWEVAPGKDGKPETRACDAESQVSLSDMLLGGEEP